MSYRKALIFFLAVQVFAFYRVLFLGEAIYPHRNEIEFGIVEPPPGRFHVTSDQAKQYVPALNRQLNGRHRAWLATWDPSVQFGRPTAQLGALSKTYLPTHILSFFTQDPFFLYTLLVVMTCALSGLFSFLLLKELRLDPWACAAAATAVARAVPLRALTVLSTVCWTLCLLYLVTRTVKRGPSWGKGVAVAFAVHGLLLSGYPQMTGVNAYLLCGYTLFLIGNPVGTLRSKGSSALFLLSAATFGVLAALPAYADLFARAAQSSRAEFGALYFFVKRAFAVKLHGVAYFFALFGPLIASAFLVSFLRRGERALWPWRIFAVLCVIPALWNPAYRFAVRHLGLVLVTDPFHILFGAFIPVCVMAAYALDRLLREPQEKDLAAKSVGALLVYGATTLAVVFLPHGFFMRAKAMWIPWTLPVLCALAFFVTRKRSVLAAAIFLSIWSWNDPYFKTQPLGAIYRSSELTDIIRTNTTDGSRFAFIGQRSVLWPNLESLAGVRSIHSYDSLASVRYQKLVGRLSEHGARTYGRVFHEITSDQRLSDDAYGYTGIGIFVSRRDWEHPALQKLHEVGRYKFYKPSWPVILEAQIAGFEEGEDGVRISGALKDQARYPVRRAESLDDRLIFKTSPAERDTLLFVSQQYHSRWRARSGRQDLKTVRVNDFYMGVLVPRGMEEVTLEFKPFSLWMWVPQALFAAAGFFLMIRRFSPVMRVGKHGRSG